ncbi:MAG: DUF4381 domain-containing protein [Myxococcota bacterium]|jgi:hypothetical protein
MDPTTDPLAGLRDIHLPETVSFWPLAPGWWLLLAALVGLTALALWLRHRRRESVRHAAVAELEGLHESYAREGDAVVLARQLSSLLRRVALVRFGHNRVAPLHGRAWAEFLEHAGRKAGFPTKLATTLEQAVYAGPSQNHEPDEVTAWISASRRWIRRVS